MAKKKLISIVGDAFADVYCYLDDETPQVIVGGDARLSQPMTTRAGGSGMNTSTHLCSLINNFSISDDTTFQVNFQTVINENDEYGKLLASHARSHGFTLLNRRVSDYPSCFFGTGEETRLLSSGGKSSGHCAVIVAKGERSFMTHLGCLDDFRGSHIINESMNDLHHIHVSGYFNIPGFWNGELRNKLAEIKQTSKEITISLVPQHDATETWDGGLLDVLQHVDFLILSEVEAKGITNYYHDSESQTFFEYAATYFHDKCPNTHVIVTLGPEGCVHIYNGATDKVETVKKEPIDPTGAGDAFAAGFIYGFLGYEAQNKDNCEINTHALRMSMLWGCASGCCCVMIDGASLPPEKRILEQALTDVLTINEAEGVKPRSEDR